MQFTAILKRVGPFFLTFAAGLFIASFFVSITPNFDLPGGRSSYKHREIRRLRVENEELRREKCRMAKEIEELRRQAELMNTFGNVPPVELDAPIPPPPPRIKTMKMGTVEIK
jgi:hypothetical protein